MTANGGKPDRRIQRTQKLLHQALVSLLAERPYETITVKDILERAEVGRSTFYMHFHDKDELLVSGIRQVLHSAHEQAAHSDGEGLLAFSLPMFEHIQQHRRSAHVNIGATGWAVVHDHLRQAIADLIEGALTRGAVRTRKVASGIPRDLLVQQVASTFILTLRWWVERRSTLRPAEINELFRALLPKDLAEQWREQRVTRIGAP
jgi:AcrR family transcriptional regulator